MWKEACKITCEACRGKPRGHTCGKAKKVRLSSAPPASWLPQPGGAVAAAPRARAPAPEPGGGTLKGTRPQPLLGAYGAR